MNEPLIYLDRKNTDCVKWDVLGRKYKNPDLLSMWLADMDFKSPACVTEALSEYLAEGLYGYYLPPDTCQDAFVNWEKSEHDYQVEKSWLRFASGVMPGIYWIVNAMTEPNDSILVLTPVYQMFLPVPEKTGRHLVTCDLRESKGVYTIDLDRLEDTIRDENVRLLIFCSPHNPVGRVWNLDELTGVLELCRKYHVYVVADEIHQDLILHGNRQIPMGSIQGYEDLVISLTAPSKTFNLAGSQYATVIIPDVQNRERIDRFTQSIDMTKGNSFAYIMAQAAYTKGKPWLESVLAQIESNEECIRKVLGQSVPEIQISPLEGTFLLWLDFGGVKGIGNLHTFLTEQCHLALNYGEDFGGDRFCHHARMNLATSQENVLRAANMISEAIR